MPVPCPKTFTLPLRLVRGPARPATLWVRPGRPADVLAADTGPDQLAAFEALPVSGATLVRMIRPATVPPMWGAGFVAVVGAAGWYVPHGRAVYPPRLPVDSGVIRWLSEDGGRLTIHTASGEFRPLADWRTVVAPPPRRFSPRPAVNPLALTEFRPASSQPVAPPPAPPLPSLSPKPIPTTRLARASRRLREVVPAVVKARTIEPAVSPAAALRPLEDRLLVELPTLPPAERAVLWVELATAYEDAGRAGDAAGCWLNAVWTHPSPPPSWAARWRAAEADAAGDPSPAVAARLAAAEVVAGVSADLSRLDAREADVPVRAVWLARAVIARRSGGDPLGLARCRDRLLARLAAGGPALHLDAPNFLRRGERPVDADAARAWLTAIAEPVWEWLRRCGPASKLTWAGLDADRAATRRYAELVQTWGSATVGDATAAERATDAAAALLAGKRSAGADPAVHRLLTVWFLARIRSALSGHPPDLAELDPDRLTGLDRYSVERLRAECECLGGGSGPFDTPAGRMVAAANTARTRHQPVMLRELLATADPTAAAYAAGPVFRAARQLGLAHDAAPLVAALAERQPPAGGRRDLGLAVGRYLVGDESGGDRTLDAARHRLLVAGGGDPRERGELAIAYANAVGHAAPRVVLGRLDELFRRLGPVSVQGATGRYFALQPLRVVDAAVRAAVGDDFAPSPAVRRFLADEELTTRRRIARDIKQVLSAEC